MRKRRIWTVLTIVGVLAFLIPWTAVADKIGFLVDISGGDSGKYATKVIAPTGSTISGTTLTLSPMDSALPDPNADVIMGWDDTDGLYAFFTMGAGLSYDHATHTVSVTGSSNAAADNSTIGISTFNSNDFNATAGLITIDYTNGQAAASGVKGFLTGADWDTFSAKQAAITRPVTGPTPSPTAGNVALFGATGQLITDGGTPQAMVNTALAAPGAIGGTTPAVGSFSRIEVTGATRPTVGLSKDGGGNLVLNDGETGYKTLAELANPTIGASNLALDAMQIPGSLDGSTLIGIALDDNITTVSGSDNSTASAKAIKTYVDNSVKLVERIGATFDGGGAAIAVNKIAYVHIPYAATINQATVVCDRDVGATTMVFDVQRLAFSTSTLPTASIIGAGTALTVPNGSLGVQITPTSWTSVALVANDTLAFKVTTASLAQWCTVSLKVTR